MRARFCAAKILLLLGAVLSFPGSRARAQTVLVQVVEAESSRPVYGAMAFLLDEQGRSVDRALTNEQGKFLFARVGPGPYTLRAEMIGRETTESTVFVVEAGGQAVVKTLAMAPKAFELAGLEAEGEGRCDVRPEEGLRVAEVWEEARKALDAAAFTDSEQTYQYKVLLSDRDLDENARRVLEESRRRSGGYLKRPFSSRPPEELVQQGFARLRPDFGGDYYAPDAEALLSDAFLDAHCFGLRVGDKEFEGMIGLTFKPVRRRGVPDISGSLWLDAKTLALETLVFRYEGLAHGIESDLVGGRIEFQRLPNGAWIIPEWFIRMPRIGMRQDHLSRRETFLTGYHQTTGVVMEVSEPGGRVVLNAQTATVDGIIFDSLQAGPLAGATVWVAGASDSTVTAADGRFRFGELTGGTYEVHFSHPYLDSLFFTPTPVSTDVGLGEVSSVRLQAPARADVLFDLCRGEDRPEGTAVFSGWVTDQATGEGIANALVKLDWDGFIRVSQASAPASSARAERMTGDLGIRALSNVLEVDTNSSGFFRICAVPEDTRLRFEISLGDLELVSDTARIGAGSGGLVKEFQIRDR